MDSSTSPAPKFRRRADARPDEVLDGAIALFADKGYAATTVQEIAAKAGLSKGAVYLYFPSKAAVLEGLVERAISPVAQTALSQLAKFSGDPRPLIAQVMKMFVARLRETDALAVPRIIVHEAVAAPEIAQMYRRAVLDKAVPALTGLIAKGVEGGFIRRVDPELTVRSVVGPILVHLLLDEIFDLRPEGGLQLERLIDNHLTILLAGLAPEKDGAS
jgi:AcrR family transcriptional regulator